MLLASPEHEHSNRITFSCVYMNRAKHVPTAGGIRDRYVLY